MILIVYYFTEGNPFDGIHWCAKKQKAANKSTLVHHMHRVRCYHFSDVKT